MNRALDAGFLPTKQIAHDELLEGIEGEGAQVAEVFDDRNRTPLIEEEREGRTLAARAIEVIEEALDGEIDQSSCRHVAGEHIEHVEAERRDPGAVFSQESLRCARLPLGLVLNHC